MRFLRFCSRHQELDENPRKALKYPPVDAAEFGKKYAQGFYTYAEAK